jgi:type VI secretion system secreted protein Hcp
MKRIFSFLLPVVALVMLSNSPAHSQIFMRAMGASGTPYPGIIEGESTSEDYSRFIEVLAYSHGIAGCPEAAKGPGGGASACKTSVGSLNIAMDLNKSVIPFKYYAMTGRILPSLDLIFRKAAGDRGGYEYYRIRMEDVVISSMQESASDEQIPKFSIEFNASKVAWGYRMQNPNGSAGNFNSFGWDIRANKPWTYQFPSMANTF